MSSRLQRIEEPLSGGTLLDRLSRDDIEDITSRNAFSNGERYWRQGRVLSLTTEKDDTRIKARVRGGRRQPYSLKIDIVDVNGELLDIVGECSCPVGFNCKHVAAALFAAMASNSTAGHGPRVTAVATAKSGPASGSIGLLPGLKPSRAPYVPPPEVLDPGLSTWIDALARLEQTETEDYPPDISQRLIYLLYVAPRAVGVPHIIVRPTSVRLLKDGRFSDKTSAFHPENVLQPDVAKFLRPSDRDILKRLHAMKSAVPVQAGTVLVGEEGVCALEAMSHQCIADSLRS